MIGRRKMTERWNVDASIKGCLVGAIADSKGNMNKVANLTGLSRATCYRLLVKYKISLKEIRENARRSTKLG